MTYEQARRLLAAEVAKSGIFAVVCCHKTRMLGAPRPLGRTCPYDKPSTEGSLLPHLPIRTPPEPTPDVFLHAWKT